MAIAHHHDPAHRLTFAIEISDAAPCLRANLNLRHLRQAQGIALRHRLQQKCAVEHPTGIAPSWQAGCAATLRRYARQNHQMPGRPPQDRLRLGPTFRLPIGGKPRHNLCHRCNPGALAAIAIDPADQPVAA